MSDIKEKKKISLSTDWQIVTLGEFVAKRTKGIVPNKTPAEMFELYSVPSLETGAPEIIEGKAIGSNKQIVDDGTVLLCKINPRINRTWVVTSHSNYQKIASTEWITFPPNGQFFPKYLAYYLKQDTIRDFLSANVSGVGGSLMRVKPATIKDYPFPLAHIDQQKRIVAEIEKQFSRLDEAVANLKRVKANLKRYKAAVLKAAVEGRLVETEAELARREGRDYETGAELLQRILETRRKQWKGKGKYKEPAPPDTTSLPELPEGWVWASLPQLGELNRGKSKHRPRDDKKLYGGPYPFIQTGDVRKSEGRISEYSQTYSEFGIQQSRLWPAGTLCITIAANIAETGILKFDACFPDSIVGFLIEAGATTTQYVEYFIRTARKKLERYAPATAQKNINLEVLSAVAVPLPPYPEQHRIVSEVDRRLSLVREVEAQVDTNLKRAERLRQTILTKAFSGQLILMSAKKMKGKA